MRRDDDQLTPTVQLDTHRLKHAHTRDTKVLQLYEISLVANFGKDRKLDYTDKSGDGAVVASPAKNKTIQSPCRDKVFSECRMNRKLEF